MSFSNWIDLIIKFGINTKNIAYFVDDEFLMLNSIKIFLKTPTKRAIIKELKNLRLNKLEPNNLNTK